MPRPGPAATGLPGAYDTRIDRLGTGACQAFGSHTGPRGRLKPAPNAPTSDRSRMRGWVRPPDRPVTSSYVNRRPLLPVQVTGRCLSGVDDSVPSSSLDRGCARRGGINDFSVECPCVGRQNRPGEFDTEVREPQHPLLEVDPSGRGVLAYRLGVQRMVDHPVEGILVRGTPGKVTESKPFPGKLRPMGNAREIF